MKVLIAEDDLVTQMALEKNLKEWGYTVLLAENGEQAWQAVQEHEPRLAIFDWMMPGMDGLELCKRIRRQQNTSYIYTILLSSKTETDDLIAGLDGGADDYITKPFDTGVLRSRMVAGARVIEYERLLAAKNAQSQSYIAEMEKLAEDRAKQLIHSEKMATVGLLSAGIAHEINNPTTFIAGNVQILEKMWDDIAPILCKQAENAKDPRPKLELILEEMPKMVSDMQNGVKRISNIVRGLKTFCRKEQVATDDCNVNTCIEQALLLCHNTVKKNITVEQELAEDLQEITAEFQQIEQVLINLFVNAADAMDEKGHGTLSVRTRTRENTVVIEVGDTGPGIPQDVLDKIWEPFFTTKPINKGTGLGLFVVCGVIEKHDGRITVENKPAGGALFTITLPASSQGEKQ
ncbi:MAG: response regulator [Planctomycetes bacterium]|nr:response regulator [Planctomycetota bacterium]